MDYKYIEQLTERYFDGETTLQEEQILKAFYAQEEQEMPEELRRYQPLFAALNDNSHVSDAFDERMLALIGENDPKGQKPAIGQSHSSDSMTQAKVVSLSERLRPLFRAAAIVAIVLTLGNAINTAQQPMVDNAQTDEVSINDGYMQAQRADSIRIDSLVSESSRF